MADETKPTQESGGARSFPIAIREYVTWDGNPLPGYEDQSGITILESEHEEPMNEPQGETLNETQEAQPEDYQTLREAIMEAAPHMDAVQFGLFMRDLNTTGRAGYRRRDGNLIIVHESRRFLMVDEFGQTHRLSRIEHVK